MSIAKNIEESVIVGVDTLAPLFQVIRCFRESGQDRCIGVDIRDGQTVREFRIAECQRYGHFRVSE